MKSSARIRHPVLFWFLALGCFVIFPLFLLNLSVKRYFEIVRKEKESAELLRAEKILARLGRNADGPVAFNDFLFDFFSNVKAENVESLEGILKTRLYQLKNRFPNQLEFIVWNSDKNLNKSLSDNSDYVFIKNKLNDFLSHLQQIAIDSFPENPQIPDLFNKEIRIFRKFLGPFIPAEKIALSFSPGESAKCFQMHGLGKKAYGWYRDFTHFSIFIYLSEELINSMVYPRQFCEQNYNPASRQNFFLINEKNLKIFPQPTERIQKNLIIQLQKSIKFTPSEMLRSTNHLFAFQRLKENWWGAAVIDTTGFARPDFNSSSLLIRCIAIVILMVFLRQCYLLVYPDPFSSIKWKLLAIFIFTVAIPVAIFSTLGYEHLLQARKHAETEKSLELIQLHNRMDKKFNNFLSDRANVITEFIENSFEKAVEEKDFETFASSLVKSFNADAILVMDQNGESLISEELSNSRVSMTLMKNLVKDLFEFLNKRKPSASNHLQSISSNFVLNFAKANRIIRRFNIISMSAYHFLYAFKDSSRPYYPYCIQLFWKTSKVHRDFFRQFSPNHNSSNQLISMLFDADNSNLISETRVKWNNIQSFLKQTTIRGINIQTCHLDSGEKYLAAGVKARNMTDIVGITLLDFSVIENEILRLKVIFAAIIVIILLMSLALYRILNFQILFPVNQLVDGVENIKDGNYNFRLKINFSNELGKLGNSINVTAENLQELAVARVVQDALIPDKIPEFPGCSLYAQTMPMSKLGGDYYDFFITSNNTLVAFLADVAGHGVQAGLIMAMAKTVLMLGKEQNHSIERIMNNLNSTFFKLRRSEIRTMLTAQIFEFFPDKNSFSFINAGHCFPLIFYNKADHGSFIDRGSYPLGFKKDRIFQHEKFEFDKGASLILYTDGILESVNESGKILGETGLKRIVKKSFENNLKKFCQNLFYEYSNWSDNQSDDITFFLIRKDMNEK